MGAREFPNAREAVEYLKGRLEEQKRVARREKLEKDLQFIRNRKESEIDISVPPCHDQELWFAKLESNGIWEKVFEFVTSPSDITSAYFACDLFRKHVEEKRKMILLPQVFGVLRDTGSLCSIHSWPSKCTQEKCRSKNKDVMNLRLVSKAWKEAAEKEFLEQPLRFNRQSGVIIPVTQCNFDSLRSVDLALEALGNGRTSSSLIRTLEVNDENCSERESFYSKLFQFLDFQGHAVGGLKFYLNYRKTSETFNYEELWNVISRMPNLKSLDLDHSNSTNEDYTVANARLQQLMAAKPFPVISSLTRFFTDISPRVNDALVVDILSKNLNIAAVDLSLIDVNAGSRLTDAVWNSLRNLSLKYFEFMCLAVEDGDFHDLLFQLGRATWSSLSVLGLTYFGPPVSVDASRIMGTLNQFNDTLASVFVRGSLQVMNDERNVVVDFPNLKNIRLPEIVNDH